MIISLTHKCISRYVRFDSMKCEIRDSMKFQRVATKENSKETEYKEIMRDHRKRVLVSKNNYVFLAKKYFLARKQDYIKADFISSPRSKNIKRVVIVNRVS